MQHHLTSHKQDCLIMTAIAFLVIVGLIVASWVDGVVL